MQNYSFGEPQIKLGVWVLGVGYGSMGAVFPAGSRGRAPSQGVRPEAKTLGFRTFNGYCKFAVF